MAAADAEIKLEVQGEQQSKRSIKVVENSLQKLGRVGVRTAQQLRDVGRAANKTTRDFIALAAASRLLEKEFGRIEKQSYRVKHVLDSTDKLIRGFGSALGGFVKGALKLATVEFGALAISMIGVHAAFAAGRLLVKAYHGTLQILAAGAAAAAVALGTISAAVREQQAAMFAYKTKTSPQFGNSLNQTRAVMRGLHSDAGLATVGIENLNKAFGIISNSAKGKGQFTQQSQALLKGLMDFASAGQPLEQGVEKAAELVATLQDTKKSFSEVKTAAKALGPQMELAVKEADKLGINTKEKFVQAIRSGRLSVLGGVQGQFAAVNDTLFAQAKGYFMQIRNMFADFGQQYLGSAKSAFEEMFFIVRSGLTAATSSITSWSRNGGLMQGLVSATEKVTTFFVHLINDWLPKSVGMFERLGNWWGRFKTGWNRVLDGLRPLIDGAKVFENFVREVFRPIWSEIKTSFKQLNQLAQDNSPQLLEFGNSIGTAVAKLLAFSREVRSLIIRELPMLTRLFNGIAEILQTLTGVISGLSGQFGGATTLFGLMGLSRGMKTTFGGFTPAGQIDKQIVYAQSVTVLDRAGALVAGTKAMFAAAPSGTGRGGPEMGAAVYAQARGFGGLAHKQLVGQHGVVAGTREYIRLSRERALQAAGKVDSNARASVAALRSASRTALKSISGTGSFANVFKSPAAGGVTTSGTGSTATTAQNQSAGGGAQPFTPRGIRGYISGLFGLNSGQQRGSVLASQTGGRASATRMMIRAARNDRVAQVLGGARDENGNVVRKGVFGGGMSSFAQAMLFNAIAGRNQELAGGMQLASMASMISPKAGMAIAGITAATRSSNAGTAILGGGAGLGLAAGAQFGAPGLIIGGLIGATMGAIMAPINKANKQRAEVKNQIDGFFSDTLGRIQANALIITRSKNTGDSALLAGMEKYQGMNRAGAAGLKGVNTKLFGRRASNAAQLGRFTLGGAAGGAGLGAAIGSVVPGIGTIAGAVIGGVVGAVGGAMVAGIEMLGRGAIELIGGGRARRNKQQKQALADIYRNKEKYGLSGLTREEYDKLQKDTGKRQLFLEEVGKQFDAREKAAGQLNDIYRKRLELFTRMTGKTEIEIEKLAQSLGVNLYDATLDLNDVISKLGINVLKTAEQIDVQLNEAIAENLKLFDRYATRAKAPNVVDELTQNFGDAIRDRVAAGESGMATPEELNNFMQSLFPSLLAGYGGDTVMATLAMRQQLGRGGSAFTQKQGPLQGLESTFYSGANAGVMDAFFGANDKAVQEVVRGQLSGILAQQGQMLGAGDLQKISSGFTSLDMNAQMALLQQLKAGTLGQGIPGGAIGALARSGLGAARGLETTAINAEDRAYYLATQNEKDMMVLDEQRKLIKSQEAFFKDYTNNKPEWWDKDALRQLFIDAGILKGDTSTPRSRNWGDTTSSRLATTMARHQAMDAQLAGRRTVTSSYRNWGLGSMNSDHVTGRAYDLVGNQLGMYKTIVERNGGFAEFHGGSINRHLHVVPGPVAGVGDTTYPQMTRGSSVATAAPASTSSTGLTIVNNFNGANPDELVDKAVSAFYRIEKEYNYRR